MAKIANLLKTKEALHLISNIIDETESAYASLRIALVLADYPDAFLHLNKINGIALYLHQEHLLICNDLLSSTIKLNPDNCFVLLKKSYVIWLDARLELELEAFNIQEFMKAPKFSNS